MTSTWTHCIQHMRRWKLFKSQVTSRIDHRKKLLTENICLYFFKMAQTHTIIFSPKALNSITHKWHFVMHEIKSKIGIHEYPIHKAITRILQRHNRYKTNKVFSLSKGIILCKSWRSLFAVRHTLSNMLNSHTTATAFVLWFKMLRSFSLMSSLDYQVRQMSMYEYILTLNGTSIHIR